MKFNLLLIASYIFCFNSQIYAQEWLGDTSFFVIQESSITSMGSENGGQHSIYHELENYNHLNWSFSLNLDFDPSNSNAAQVFLSQTNSMEDDFLRITIGESGTNDGLMITQVKQGLVVLDTTLAQGLFSSSFNYDFNIDILDQDLTFLVTSKNDTLIKTSLPYTKTFYSYCGLSIKYTSTRKDKFHFSNWQTNLQNIETPFSVTNIVREGSHAMRIDFSEPLDSSHFWITNPSINHFTTIENNSLNITTSSPLIGNVHFGGLFCAISGEKVSLDTLIHFNTPTHIPVYITELMIDPTPALLLPEEETIEIYNASDRVISTENWKVCDATTCQTIPNFNLEPHEYYTLTTIEHPLIANPILIDRLPSLNNDIDSIYLIDSDNQVIHTVFYNTSVLGNSNGGTSIELNDIENPCFYSNKNWQYSPHYSGGTPGKQNNTRSNSSINYHQLYHLKVLDKNHLLFQTDITINDYSLTSFWESDDNDVISTTKTKEGYILKLNSNLQEGELYEITHQLETCNGRTQTIIQPFVLPIELQANELKINEIFKGQNDADCAFVEVKNDSEHSINLNQIHLGIFKGGKVENIFTCQENIIISPRQHPIFTHNKVCVLNHFNVTNEHLIFEINELTLYKENPILLINDTGKKIDSLDLADLEVPSHEDTGLPRSWERHNTTWQLSGKNSFYGSPTQENATITRTDENSVTLSSPIISPNNDLYQDQLVINIHLSGNNYNGNFLIFQSDGMLIKTLHSNIALSANGELYWNGTNDSGNLVEQNVYLLFVEIYTFEGEREIFKLPITVSRD